MKVLDWWGIQCCLPRTIDLLLLQWPEMVHGKFQRSAWRLISSSTIWGIWLLRNKIVFEEGTINLFDCFSTILHRVAIWLHSQDSNFNYTGNDLLRSSDGIKLWCNKKSQVVFLLFAVVDQFFFLFSSCISFWLFTLWPSQYTLDDYQKKKPGTY